MFIVLLEFSDDKARASQLMAGHNAWLAQGFADGVFVLAGGLQPKRGGAIVAHATSLTELQGRVNTDPFVAHGVVRAQILELTPSKFDERLAFLAAEGT